MNENIFLMRRAKQQLTDKWLHVAVGSLIYMVILGIVSGTSLLELILYGPLTFGYYLYVSCIVDTGQDNLSLLFRGFDRFVETLLAGLLMSLAIVIGLVLLIVPGIIVACGLSMTFFIMIDDPNISGLDALQQSWNMMKGQKWNFFCLELRFFGWILLCLLTCGIGYIFLTPYMVATGQNFYRKLRYGTY